MSLFALNSTKKTLCKHFFTKEKNYFHNGKHKQKQVKMLNHQKQKYSLCDPLGM